MLYHGSPYGKETIPIYELLAQKYGFTVQQIEVPHPGNEQQSQWLTIRRAKPDYVVLRGWGVMNPVALKTAQKVGFPADHIIGNVWSNSEEDVIPAGDAAKGYIAITTQASGSQYPVLQEIIKTVYGAGKGNLDDKKRIGSVYHNLGIVNGILNVEAVRIAQEKFGHRTLTGDEVRWGFEHLQARSGARRGARRQGPVPFDQRHLGQPRRRRPRDVPAMGRRRSGRSSAIGSRRTGSCCGRSSRSRPRLMPQSTRHQDPHLGQRRGRLSRTDATRDRPAAGPAAQATVEAAAFRRVHAADSSRCCKSPTCRSDLQQRDRRAAWRQPDASQGEIRRSARRQWRRQDDNAEGGLESASGRARRRSRQARIRFDGLDVSARRRLRARPRTVSCRCSKGRHCFRSLTVEENLDRRRASAEARAAARPRRISSASTAISRA